MEKIMGYVDYQIGNVTILRVYYVEGLGHNLFSIGKFCDSNLEVAFRQHTCFIYNLEGVDLFTGSRGKNLYTSSHEDMMATSPICILSKASKTKSWLWHRRQSHLNFDNETKFVNQTLREYYEKVGFSHETSIARSPQQNGVVERCNRTLIEATRTSLELTLHEMTPATISLGLIPNPPLSTPYVPPSRTEWNILFEQLFDELLNPPPSVDLPAFEVIAPIAKVVAPEPVVSTGSPSSTTVDQDAPSPIEPKTYKDALTQSCWIEAMQEELNEFERLEVWELIPHPDKMMVINLKWIYKVKLYELGGILKNKARLVARGYHQEKGIGFEESFALFLLRNSLKESWILHCSSKGKAKIFFWTTDFTKHQRHLLNQSKYALESLKKYGMESSDPVDTPTVEKSKLDEDPLRKAVDLTHYGGMVGTLMYLPASRPDLTFVVCMCARKNMNTTQAQQKAPDDALVALEDRLEFGKCNMRLKTDIKPKEATFQVVLDALAFTSFYQAFLITSEVPAIYMQEFWAKTTVHKSSIRFTINKKKFPIDVKVKNKEVKKTNKMSYPIFKKIIIDYFMSKDQSISRRNKMFWHTARDDTMFTTMRSYKTYYAYATGENALKEKYVRKKAESDISPKKKTTPASKGSRLKSSIKMAKTDKKKQPAKMPKTKGLDVLTEVAFTKAKQIKLATKRRKNDFHMSHASGSGNRVDTQSKIPDEQQQKTFSQDKDDADEETDVNDDSEETKSDNDGDDLTHPNLSTYKADVKEEEEEKADDEEGDDEDMEGEQEQDEEDDPYRDVNINLERSDAEMSNAQANQDTKDTHVTLTTVPLVVKQQSSFVSSDLVSKFIYPSLDTCIDSILNPIIQSKTLVNVPVFIAVKTPSFDTIIPQPPIFNIQPLQQTPGSTTTTTIPTMTFPDIPNFASLF
nr:integrase, catalytic region, zinc finger, CCHC-type, peptidase aspartic, catalytic [Tanacetum cinerariifolium]